MSEQVTIDSSIKLDHIGRIYKMVSVIPFFEGKRINAIEILHGGLTNSNYKVTIDNHDYALRIAGDGTMEYLNRPAEKVAANLMADININAGVIYYDDTTGCQVCEYIDGKTLHIPDFKEDHYIKKAALLFKTYHSSGKEFISEFNLLKEIESYKNLLAQKNYGFYDNAELFEAKIKEIADLYAINPPQLAPCHNDPLCENWMDDEKNFYLIDWEYCGMNDPMFDLAAICLEAELNDDQEKLLLTTYFGGELTDKQYGSLIINKFLCDALWSYWAVLQIANGKSHDDYWPYGLNRFNRAYELINNGSLDKAIAAQK